SECRLGVDIAALKAETLSHYNDQHGVPLRSRVFGAIRTLNRLGAAAAPVSNIPGRVRPMRRLMGRTMGIAPQRPLPAFQRRTLPRWFATRQAQSQRTDLGWVTFLADSFTTFTEPHIGQAAVELLERAGWQVRLQGTGCCGRSSLSKGLLDDAMARAAKL